MSSSSNMKAWMIGLAQTYGNMAMDMRYTSLVETKADADSSPLTEIGSRINEGLIRDIKERYPDDAVLGEEGSVPGTSGITWAQDPDDGSRVLAIGAPFVAPAFARLDSNGYPTHAVVRNPVMGRTFYAERGRGTILLEDGKEYMVKVSGATSFNKTTVFAQCRKSSQFAAFDFARFLTERGANNLSLGSTIDEATYVAMGGRALAGADPVVAAVFFQDKLYDVAASKLIVEEAGGRVTDIFGNDQRYDKPINGALITNLGIAGELAQLAKMHIRPHRK